MSRKENPFGGPNRESDDIENLDEIMESVTGPGKHEIIDSPAWSTKTDDDTITVVTTMKKSQARLPTKETIKRRTIADMKALGVHKPQYNRIIEIYAGMVYEYNMLEESFALSGYQYETETAAGNPKKSSVVTAKEALRKDIARYSDMLCLNPKSLESVTIENKKQNKLAGLLNGIG